MPHQSSSSTIAATAAPASATTVASHDTMASTTTTSASSSASIAYSPPRIDENTVASIMRNHPSSISVTAAPSAAAAAVAKHTDSPAGAAGGAASTGASTSGANSSIVTPLVGSKPWVGVGGTTIFHSHHAAAAAASAAAAQHLHHPAHPSYGQHHPHHLSASLSSVAHLLPTGKSSDSTDARSTATHASQASSAPTLSTEVGPSTTTPTSATTRPADSMDERDGAANALLGLFTSSNATTTTTNTAGSDQATVLSSSSYPTVQRTGSSPSIPLKKRLLMGDDVPQQPTSAAEACHISPVSHSSLSGHNTPRTDESRDAPSSQVAGAGVTTNDDAAATTTTSSTDNGRTTNHSNTSTANRSASYDSTTVKDSTSTTTSTGSLGVVAESSAAAASGGGTNLSTPAMYQQRTQALLAESKVHNASQIGLSAQQLAASNRMSSVSTTLASRADATGVVGTTSAATGTTAASPPRMVPHFPTMLHQVLAEPSLAMGPNAALQWLPDGESFCIKNWTALRRQVLPAYFSDLRDEHGAASSAGTIDAFLYHLGAWGFEEVKSSSDDATSAASTGAYRHELFIRGAQKLCVRMRFTADQMDGHQGPKTVSPTRPSLQVPTLTSQDRMVDGTSGQPGSASMLPNKRPRYDAPVAAHMHWPYGSAGDHWGGMHHRHLLPPQHYHSPEHMYGMRAGANGSATTALAGPYSGGGGVPGVSSYPSELQFRRQSMDSISSATKPPVAGAPGIGAPRHYSPPQVRSARGGLRLPANRTAVASQKSTPAPSVVRQNFPVSNRGKGPRKPAAVRTTAPPPAKPTQTKDSGSGADQDKTEAQSTVSSSTKPITTLSEAQRIGQGVVNSLARKTSGGTKRKLPMAASAAKEKAAVADDDSTSKQPKEEAMKMELSVPSATVEVEEEKKEDD